MKANRQFYVTFERVQRLGILVRASDAGEARALALVSLRDAEEGDWDEIELGRIIDVDGPLEER